MGLPLQSQTGNRRPTRRRSSRLSLSSAISTNKLQVAERGAGRRVPRPREFSLLPFGIDFRDISCAKSQIVATSSARTVGRHHAKAAREADTASPKPFQGQGKRPRRHLAMPHCGPGDHNRFRLVCAVPADRADAQSPVRQPSPCAKSSKDRGGPRRSTRRSDVARDPYLVSCIESR